MSILMIEEILMYQLAYYGDITGKGEIVTVGVLDGVGVLLGVDEGVHVKDAVMVNVFVGDSVGGTKMVAVDVAEGVKVGVFVAVDEGVMVGVSDGVWVNIDGSGLKVTDGAVAVDANVGLGVAVGDESGAREIAIMPIQ